MGANEFSVYLIPETLRVTVLGQLAVGDPVNIEIDSQTQVPAPPLAWTDCCVPRAGARLRPTAASWILHMLMLLA